MEMIEKEGGRKRSGGRQILPLKVEWTKPTGTKQTLFISEKT